MLTATDLHVSYGSIVALRGVSIEVQQGELVGVIGPNGAGKSTLLKAIVGAVRPKQGGITIDAKSILGKSPEAIVRLGASLVPEGRHIFTKLTVAENLQLGAIVQRDRTHAEADLEQALALFPVLKDYYRSQAGKLSGGEQQMLAIARALLSRPRLLMLDEPSLGLAPLVVDRVFDSLDRLRAAGITILLIEQNAARTIELADRIYVLRTGRVEFVGTEEEFADSSAYEHALFGIT
ncbi:MAG TPA: ABC transporter ATP-binding protein [Acidimicrobiia bacterium]|nr:ABC transporter ATP-binding protein [Acidimicrobiia bacterium]